MSAQSNESSILPIGASGREVLEAREALAKNPKSRSAKDALVAARYRARIANMRYLCWALR